MNINNVKELNGNQFKLLFASLEVIKGAIKHDTERSSNTNKTNETG